MSATKSGKVATPNPALEKMNALDTKMEKMGSIFSLVVCFIILFVFFLIIVWILHPKVSTNPGGGQNFWVNAGVAAVITIVLIVILFILKALKCLSWCRQDKSE